MAAHPAGSRRRSLLSFLSLLVAALGLAAPYLLVRAMPGDPDEWRTQESARLERRAAELAAELTVTVGELNRVVAAASDSLLGDGERSMPAEPLRAFEALAAVAAQSERAGGPLGSGLEWGIHIEEDRRDAAWWGRPLVSAGEGPRNGAFLLARRLRTAVAVSKSPAWTRRIVASALVRLPGDEEDPATARLIPAGEAIPPDAENPRASVPVDFDGQRLGWLVLDGETLGGARARRRGVGEMLRFALIGLGALGFAGRFRPKRRSRSSPAGSGLALSLAMLWAARVVLALVRPGPHGPGASLFGPFDFAGSAPLGLLRSPADLFLSIITIAATVRLVDRAARRSERSPSAPLRAAALLCVPLLWIAAQRAAAAAIYGSGPRLFETPLPDLTPASVLLLLSFALGGFAAFRLLLVGVRVAGLAVRPLLSIPLLAAICLLPLLGGRAAELLPGAPFLAAALGTAVGLSWIEGRRGAAGIGRGALFLLGACLTLLPGVDRGLEARDRDHIKEVAARFVTPRDEWRRFVLEETLAFFGTRAGLVEELTHAVPERLENLAFVEWLESPLASLGYECSLEILDASGAVVSRFSIGLPTESGHDATFAFRDARLSEQPVIRTGRRRVGRDVLDAYLGAVPLFTPAGNVAGAVVITIPYFFENLAYATRPAATRPLLLGTGTSTDIPTSLEGRLIVSRFVSERLVASSDPTIAPGLSLTPDLAAAPPGTFHDGTLYSGRETTLLAPLPRAPGDAGPPGRLAFTLQRSGMRDLLRRLVHIALVAAVLLLTRALGLVLLRALRGRAHVVTFRERLLAAFLVIAVIPALLMGVLTYRLTTRRMADSSQREALEGLEAARSLMRARSVAEATRLSRATLIRRLVLGLETLASIDLETGLKKFSLFSPDGELLLQNGVVPDFAPARVRSIATNLSPVTFFSPEDGLSVVSAVPVVFEGADDPGKGVLLLRTPVDDELMLTLGEEGNRDLIAYGEGGVVATNRPELFQSELLPRRMDAEAFVECFLHRKDAVFGAGTIAGRPTVVAYGALSGQQGAPLGALAVPLLFRQREIDSTISSALASILYVTVLVLVAVAFLASLVAERIAKPVAELSAGTQRIARGELSFSLQRTTGGELGELVDSFNRMTEELRLSRDRILERTRYIEAILGNMTTGVLALDQDGRIITLNRGGARILGLREGSGIGRTAAWLRDGVHDVLADTLEAIGSAPDGILERELALPRADTAATRRESAAPDDAGEVGADPVKAVRAVGTRLLNETGDELGRVLVFEDLTELIRSKKLLAWGEMARQVAHEIKNPLTPMKLSAQHIREAYRDRAPGFGGILEEGTEAIIAEIESLRRIATEFSSFARMPRRVVKAEDLNEIVRESVRMYHDARGISLELELAESPVRARVDRQEMKRVFMNLIENAVHASGKGARVSVRTLAPPASIDAVRERPAASAAGDGLVEWSGRPPRTDSPVAVLIEDEGSGIPSDSRGHLFEPYFSTKTEGTGLGLAICKGIVEEHGGAIRISSQSGGGTCVMVVVPGLE